MKRNYLPIGKEPKFNHYHECIDRFMSDSQILNSGNKNPGVSYVFWDKNSLQIELLKLEGDTDGKFFKEGKTTFAEIPFYKMLLKEVNDSWEKHTESIVKQGKSKPTEWTKAMLNKRLELEARLLVLEEEVITIKKKLSEFVEKENNESDRKVLTNGPRGVGRMSGGYLIELDGMHVSLTDEKIPYINDPRAPLYTGYKTSDYFEHIVKPYAFARAELMKKTQKEIQAGRNANEIPSGLKTGSSAKWPKFPELVQKAIINKKEQA